MPTLALIRGATVFDCWDFYERKTEVIVFGDIADYRYLIRALLRAISGRRNVHLGIVAANPNSMRAVILPAQKTRFRNPRLKFIERLVYIRHKPNMELIIIGNASGYRHLARLLASLIRLQAKGPSEHRHLDDATDDCVCPRSVSLNIRAPLKKWSRAQLEEFHRLVETRTEDFLPKDLSYRFSHHAPYEELNPAESDFLRL